MFLNLETTAGNFGAFQMLRRSFAYVSILVRYSFSRIIVFNQNLIGDFMCDLPSSVEEQFAEGSANWFLQEDNDPKRRWCVAFEWKDDNRVQILP